MNTAVILASLLLGSLRITSAVIYTCNQTVSCGCSAYNANMYRIVGGENVFPFSWGWAVSLQSIYGRHFCTGSVVSPLHVVTAAHCIVGDDFVNQTQVVIGINAQSDVDSPTLQMRLLSAVFVHPSYNEMTHLNDIAVLRLNESFVISSTVHTARLCLPRIEPSSRTSRYPGDHGSLVAIGWGALKSGDLSLPDYLQQVTVKAIPATDDRCGMFLNNSSIQMCAGVDGGGKDTCQGDSGGPLMRFEPKLKRWVLAGVTSFGLGCADPRFSGVYTRVSMFRDWLRSVITDEYIEVLGEPYSSALEIRFNICLMLVTMVLHTLAA